MKRFWKCCETDRHHFPPRIFYNAFAQSSADFRAIFSLMHAWAFPFTECPNVMLWCAQLLSVPRHWNCARVGAQSWMGLRHRNNCPPPNKKKKIVTGSAITLRRKIGKYGNCFGVCNFISLNLQFWKGRKLHRNIKVLGERVTLNCHFP